MTTPTLASRITFDHLLALERQHLAPRGRGPRRRGFWQCVAVTDDPRDCWEWTRAQTNYYGRVHVGQLVTGYERHIMLLAHRVALSLALGRLLPEGTTVDHVCGNTMCCNPSHLEAVDHAENVKRARWTVEAMQGPRKGLRLDQLVIHADMRTGWLDAVS